MIKSIIGLRGFWGIVFVLIASSSAHSQASRTWVSGVGDDVNPCSRTAPCKTFAGAIFRTNTGGEIDCLDSGGFGTVTISKSVTIDGTGFQAGIAAGGTTGININIPAADASKTVRLRHLNINGMGNGVNGINVAHVGRLFIDDVSIDGFSNHGILVGAEQPEIFVNNTIIKNVGKSGIEFVPTGALASLFVNRSTMSGTFTALAVSKGGRATIRDSSIFNNRNGLVADNSDLNAIDCVLTANETAITARDQSVVRLSQVSVINNRTGLLIVGGKILAFNHVLINGNSTDGAPSATIPTP